MQRINFTETTLTTLKRNANCSFANAVYKLGIKAQQGLKCDDLFKKSVLMNEVNKLLCKYKLDECISFHPFQEGGISTWTFGVGDISPYIWEIYLNINDVVTLIGVGTDLAEIAIDINANTETTGVSAELSEDGDYMTVYSPPGCFVKGDLIRNSTKPGTTPQSLITFVAGKCPQEETCVDYTEEELNCITPQDLQVLYEFTHKYKETLAKSTKKITNQTTSNSNSSSSDCCEWGKISGSIGNQSDLVAYLQTIEKNFISAYDESTLLSSDIKSLKFLGAGVTATNSSGDISITIPGGGSGGSVAWGAITGTITDQTDLINYLIANYTISATNGLTESPTNTVKLGGTLIEDTAITSSTFSTKIIGEPALKTDNLLNLTTTSGLGGALKITANKNGIDLSSGAVGLSIVSSTAPILAQGSLASALSKTGTTDSAVDTILSLGRGNTGNAPSLINSGVAISFYPGNDSGGGAPSGSLLSLLYEDPTNSATETKFRFNPLGTGSNLYGSTLETYGSGKLKLPAYGQTPANFTGTPVWLLGVDATGNVVETSVGGGGGGDVVGPASAVDNNIAVFDTITGKLIKDGGATVASLAPLASPTFTGTPEAPTAAQGTNTTQVATTQFVQTELNAKSPIANCSAGTAVTITVFNTYSKGLLIPANSRAANDVPQIDVKVDKTGTSGTLIIRLYWNTTDDLLGSPILLATSTTSATATRYFAIQRILSIESATTTTRLLAPATASIGDVGAISAATSTVAIDWTAAGYLICAVQNGSAADSSVCNMIKLH